MSLPINLACFCDLTSLHVSPNGKVTTLKSVGSIVGYNLNETAVSNKGVCAVQVSVIYQLLRETDNIDVMLPFQNGTANHSGIGSIKNFRLSMLHSKKHRKYANLCTYIFILQLSLYFHCTKSWNGGCK